MKLWIAVLLILLMIIGENALAGDDIAGMVSGDDWTASVKNGAVHVVDSEGNEMACLEYEKEEGVRDFLLAEDYNFDGVKDLAALRAMGTVNAYYSLWL